MMPDPPNLIKLKLFYYSHFTKRESKAQSKCDLLRGTEVVRSKDTT
jgi:hypothetical protein